MRSIKRGDIFYADLNPVVGSEQGGNRPVVVVQNNTGNQCSPTVIVAVLTSKIKKSLPTHIDLTSDESNLAKDSTVMLEQIKTIDKTRLKKFIGVVPPDKMCAINQAIIVSLGLKFSQ